MQTKFLALTDLHHEPQVFAHDAPEFLGQIMRRAADEEVSFAIQLGDFLHTPALNRSLADVFGGTPMPVHHVFGNHDTDQENYEYILEMYHLTRGYYCFDEGGYRFIILDPNYAVVDGELVHYAPRQNRNHHLGEIPAEQLEWLRQTIEEAEGPCIICSHQSIERSDGIKNRDDVWKIICETNRKRRHSVIMYINGHYHNDSCTIVNGVCCLDLNSVSYYWCDVVNSLYPKELVEKFPLSSNCLYYKKPLSAVITISGTNSIRIDGADGEYICPISHDELLRLDQRRLCEERISTPYIRSYSVDLDRNTVVISDN